MRVSSCNRQKRLVFAVQYGRGTPSHMLAFLASFFTFAMMCCWISRKHLCPVHCAICDKKSKKAYFRLKSEEKRKWSFLEGHGICVECLLSLEMGYSDFDQRGRYSSRVLSRHSTQKTKGKLSSRQTRLKKVDSGKAWERSRSFRAPYIESPSVTEKVAKCNGKAIFQQRVQPPEEVSNESGKAQTKTTSSSQYLHESLFQNRPSGSYPELLLPLH